MHKVLQTNVYSSGQLSIDFSIIQAAVALK